MAVAPNRAATEKYPFNVAKLMSVESEQTGLSAGGREFLKLGFVALFAFVVLGLVVTFSDVPVRHALEIAGITAIAALASTALGAAALFAARRRSIGSQAGLLALVAVVGAGIGAWAVANAMFLSQHDFSVLLVVLATAAVANALGALALGRRVNAATEELIQAARQLDGSGSLNVAATGKSTELARLAVELKDTSKRLRDTQARMDAIEQSRRDLMSWISGDLHALVDELESRLDGSDRIDLSNDVSRMRIAVDDLLELNSGRQGQTSKSGLI